METNSILGWRAFLVIISIFNVAFISIYYLTHTLNYKQTFAFVLAFIFSIVCAIRTISPTKYTEKTCFIKTGFLTPFNTKILTTIAELAYVILCVYIFLHIITLVQQYSNKKLDHIKPYIYAVIPIVVMAEIFSWSGSIFDYKLLNITEDVLWIIASIVLIALSLYTLFTIKNIKSPKITPIYNFFTITIPFATLFVAVLAAIDIPLYIKKWNIDRSGGSSRSSGSGGRSDGSDGSDGSSRSSGSGGSGISIKDYILDFKKQHKIDYRKKINELQHCNKVDQSFNTWKDEIPWLTGYFTLGVWSSFGLAIWFKNNS